MRLHSLQWHRYSRLYCCYFIWLVQTSNWAAHFHSLFVSHSILHALLPISKVAGITWIYNFQPWQAKGIVIQALRWGVRAAEWVFSLTDSLRAGLVQVHIYISYAKCVWASRFFLSCPCIVILWASPLLYWLAISRFMRLQLIASRALLVRIPHLHCVLFSPAP